MLYSVSCYRDYVNRLLPYATIAVIAYGGTLRALMPIIKNEPKETSFKYDFHNASVTIFERKDEKYSSVVENDTSHLL